MEQITQDFTQVDYFSKLLNKLQRQNIKQGLTQSSFPDVEYQTSKCIEQAYDQIIFGMIQFKQNPDKVEAIIKVPSHKKSSGDQKQIDEMIKLNEEMLKKAKRQLLIHKKLQQQTNKLDHEIKIRQNQQKINKWTEQQRIFNQKRQLLIQKRQRQIKQQQERIEQQRRLSKQKQFQQRKRSLQNRLRQMQQSKERRRQLFELSKQETKKIKQPKFRRIQKQFQKVIAEENFQKEIKRKNNKLSKQVNFDSIKEHQKNYMEKLFQRLKQKGYSSQRTLNEEEKQMYESRFKTLLRRTEEQIEEEKEKFKRRMDYQNRIQQIQLNVDQSKKISIEIAKDKAKNPLKYNFLKQKQLNDYQIYTQFKDFVLDIDRNQLGKGYLEEARKIGEQSRIKKSFSVSAFTQKQKQKQHRYKDYLPQIRGHKTSYNTQKNIVQPKSIEQVFRKEGNREKAIQKISISLKKYDDSTIDKKIQLKSLNTISSTLRKEREIDDMFMKSLKAKLACLQMQSQSQRKKLKSQI